MRKSIFAAALATGLAVQSGPTAAWYQWYQQDIPFAPVSGLWFYQNIPYGAAGTNPFLGQTSPWFWFYQPGQLNWWSMPGMVSGTYVEQSQSPSAYHIRVQAPGGWPGNLQIGVESGAILIRSSEVSTAGDPLQSRQTGWSTQWIRLPADANLAAMRISRHGGGAEILVPRLR